MSLPWNHLSFNRESSSPLFPCWKDNSLSGLCSTQQGQWGLLAGISMYSVFRFPTQSWDSLIIFCAWQMVSSTISPLQSHPNKILILTLGIDWEISIFCHQWIPKSLIRTKHQSKKLSSSTFPQKMEIQIPALSYNQSQEDFSISFGREFPDCLGSSTSSLFVLDLFLSDLPGKAQAKPCMSLRV